MFSIQAIIDKKCVCFPSLDRPTKKPPTQNNVLMICKKKEFIAFRIS
jgi:hypothetical protein